VGLNTALVDLARIHRRAPAQKVAGRTQFAPITSAWFRARVDQRTNPETRNQPSGQPRVTKQPRLMYALRDTEGRDTTVNASDFVEVAPSDPHLDAAWYQVEGDPDPIRKKRRVIGWEVTLKRLAENPFDPTGQQAALTG
jgi:hypothetical protein